jgi:hypothetical protein
VGEKATCRYKKELHFVDEKEKNEVLNYLKEAFFETSVRYLSSKDSFSKNIKRPLQTKQID